MIGRSINMEVPTLRDSLSCDTNQCVCDITTGISGETVPRGREPPYLLTSFQSCHLVMGGSNIWDWCVIPHSSPTRGHWPQTIFNILIIFIKINQIENRQIIAQYHYFAGFSLHPCPMGWSHDHMTGGFPSLLHHQHHGPHQS